MLYRVSCIMFAGKHERISHEPNRTRNTEHRRTATALAQKVQTNFEASQIHALQPLAPSLPRAPRACAGAASTFRTPHHSLTTTSLQHILTSASTPCAACGRNTPLCRVCAENPRTPRSCRPHLAHTWPLPLVTRSTRSHPATPPTARTTANVPVKVGGELAEDDDAFSVSDTEAGKSDDDVDHDHVVTAACDSDDGGVKPLMNHIMAYAERLLLRVSHRTSPGVVLGSKFNPQHVPGDTMPSCYGCPQCVSRQCWWGQRKLFRPSSEPLVVCVHR